MVVLSPALLSLLLPAAALARPNQHERLHHKRGGFSDINPTGIHGAPPTVYPHPTGTAGPTAPFPVGNSTLAHPAPSGSGAGSGTGPITIKSIITIVPFPSDSGHSLPHSSKGASPGSPSGAPGGPGGSGSGEECGPETVTVTNANTVTVTVPPPGSQPPSLPETPSSLAHSSPPETSSSFAASSPLQTSSSSSSTSHYSAPSITLSATAAETKTSPEVKPAIEPSETKPKSEKASTKADATQPETEEKLAVKPVVEQKNPVKSSSSRHEQHTPTSHSNPSSPKTTSSSPASPSPSHAPSTDNSNAKGLLYQDINLAKSSPNIGWFGNWDSSPIPAVGKKQGHLDGFIPQMWGPDQSHTDVWEENSAGYPWVISFNEPNQPKDKGGCAIFDVGTTVAKHKELLGPNKAAGQKVTSPCVSNDVHDWLEQFFDQIKDDLLPDAVCFHWYGAELQGLKDTVKGYKELQEQFGVQELWMTEWAFHNDLSSEDASELMEFLKQSGLNRYAYNTDHAAGWDAAPNIKNAYTA